MIPLPEKQEGTHWITNQHGHAELETGYGYTADQMHAHAEAARDAEVARWKAALDPVMPADFKTWHQNAMAELPEIAAWVITNAREQREWAEQALAAARRQALEEAALLIEQRTERRRWIRGAANAQAIKPCEHAAAIRSLIDKDATSGEPDRSCPAPTAPRPGS